MNLSEVRGLALFRVIRGVGASSVIGLGDTAQITCEAQPAGSGIRLVYHVALVVGSNELVTLFRAERSRPESWVPPALGWSVAQGLRRQRQTSCLCGRKGQGKLCSAGTSS
jgi:hypothetical protein